MNLFCFKWELGDRMCCCFLVQEVIHLLTQKGLHGAQCVMACGVFLNLELALRYYIGPFS